MKFIVWKDMTTIIIETSLKIEEIKEEINLMVYKLEISDVLVEAEFQEYASTKIITRRNEKMNGHLISISFPYYENSYFDEDAGVEIIKSGDVSIRVARKNKNIQMKDNISYNKVDDMYYYIV